MRAQALLSFAIMASTATAIANETATIIFTEMDSVDLVGKVIGTDGLLTTYVINCNPKPPKQNFYQVGDCVSSSHGWTVTAGPSTMRVAFDDPEATMIEACTLHDSTSLNCDITMDYGSSTDVESDGGTTAPASDFYRTVTITGTEIASGSASAQTSPTAGRATATTTGTASATAAAGESGSGAQKAAANTASSTAGASQSTNAAMAQVTGNARWAVGGAAAMAAIAMVLE
ncbi:putative GPI anchored glyco protein [Aspergillus flavus]|uniref:GPI anchored glyco protein n=1 Tax=Aspergillus flavus (strain ATCC 200026 / FGSC A1120 / IAM 13836 / NRRL 3357 / JCM 12722 / SRRC 167) TaxID=332952 RepID=A0A7U2MVM5_ASPFN|nr:hypothetical protein AFLA_011753 [Aspergillus flavus NRRL3357]QRD90693.1 putative GPI anchored glyco protein [Aspergillus flavus]